MKQRIISAIIALIIVVPIIIYGKMPFYLGASIIGLIGFLELIKAIEKDNKLPNGMKIVGIILFILLMMNGWGKGRMFFGTEELIISILITTIAPIVYYHKSKLYNFENAAILACSIILLGLAFNNLVNVRIANINYFIYILLITTMSDTFAYFTGMLIGKNKMCPSVSPKKTWEGFAGGLVFGTFISTMSYVIMFDYTGSIIVLVLVTAILSIIGQLGDLIFSSIKRHYGIKDFGNIMPGHGGVLDRLDSILFVVLVFIYLSRFI